LQEKVKLPGRIPDQELSCYFMLADLFCLPSTERSEAFGVVQLEAMYFCKPIVATDIPGSGVNWVNLHKVTGLNVLPGKETDLATAISTILERPDLKSKFSQNSYARFKGNFTRLHMVEALKDLFSRILIEKDVYETSE